jgi:hypothetical protein
MGILFPTIVGRHFLGRGSVRGSLEPLRQTAQFLSQKRVGAACGTPPAISAFTQKELLRRHVGLFSLYVVTPNKRCRPASSSPV